MPRRIDEYVDRRSSRDTREEMRSNALSVLSPLWTNETMQSAGLWSVELWATTKHRIRNIPQRFQLRYRFHTFANASSVRCSSRVVITTCLPVCMLLHSPQHNQTKFQWRYCLSVGIRWFKFCIVTQSILIVAYVLSAQRSQCFMCLHIKRINHVNRCLAHVIATNTEPENESGPHGKKKIYLKTQSRECKRFLFYVRVRIRRE